ncbi:MAG: hypothetical protein CMF38_05100 [Legionellaceae bacterium]|nr:hypothetical protein [Legionellaceae bacterium]HAF87991.1 hypothetical protein [Legionellales bacterium]HCA89453.1 hypothetical protein [Legionellales bacterium]|tara:strand:+ start:256 stop:552 length:297 start_codon:yes stop_codon:yes gene_type:complete
MNQAYTEQWTEMAKKMQEPWQAMAELNLKTMQSMSALNAKELKDIKEPKELLEKNLNLAIENGHKALEYMQKSFDIFEQTMKSALNDTQQKVDKELKK